MITMMVLLCYVNNLSGMSLECIVIILMNKLLLGGQFCTDSIDIQQNGTNLWAIGHNRTAVIPYFNFTCNGRINSIRARLLFNMYRFNYPLFQVWRPASSDSRIYYKISEVQLFDDQVTRGSNNHTEAKIILTGNNTIEVRSGDIVGYYQPPNPRYRVRTVQNVGYQIYQFHGSSVPTSVNLSDANHRNNNRQPLIQFTIGMYVLNLVGWYCFKMLCIKMLSKHELYS